MKRQNRKTKNKKTVSPAVAARPTVQSGNRNVSRRDFFVNALIYSASAAAVTGGGWYLFDIVDAEAKESDLTTLGNGVPAIVQIHDPNCPTCNALRREARDAACSFDDSELQFKVASLQTEAGRRLAARHGVGKITLLMFDGDGSMRIALPGMNQSEDLRPVFERHIARYGKGNDGANSVKTR